MGENLLPLTNDDGGDRETAEMLIIRMSARALIREAAGHVRSLNSVMERLERLVGPDAEPEVTVPFQRPGGCEHEHEHEHEAAVAARSEAVGKLTVRERDVLDLLVQGLSNRLIARALRISEPTVKNHLHAIFLKLEVADRTQAIAKVLGTAPPEGVRRMSG
ncbi:helix-turn-helix transcriptional regulator [Actinomadura rudentiformis]|uniref:helix-turn-helix transcriptional regulator n=1 Tax=Actinomadura rudentiformis TaxID=359158 RepID=UPI001CEF7E82|nr:LuxR C-terminal-related transcriptional regulator [Actinomadura rudentiformis]